MDLGRGYGLTDHERFLLAVLLGVASVVQGRVGLPGVVLGRDHDTAAALLVADGLVVDEQTNDGHELALTAHGLRVVRDVEDRRMDPRGRYVAVRGALREWLGDQYMAEGLAPGRWEDSFRTSRWGMYLGESFNDQEMARGMKSLLDDGDVTAIESWGPDIARPKLTPQGRDRVFGDRRVGDTGRVDGGGDTHFYGPVTGSQVNYGTTGSVQNVHVTADQLEGIRRLLAAVLADTELAARVEVSNAVAVVEDAIEENPVAPPRLRRVLGRLGDKVLGAAVGAVTAPGWDALGHQIYAVAEAIGH